MLGNRFQGMVGQTTAREGRQRVSIGTCGIGCALFCVHLGIPLITNNPDRGQRRFREASLVEVIPTRVLGGTAVGSRSSRTDGEGTRPISSILLRDRQGAVRTKSTVILAIEDPIWSWSTLRNRSCTSTEFPRNTRAIWGRPGSGELAADLIIVLGVIDHDITVTRFPLRKE